MTAAICAAAVGVIGGAIVGGQNARRQQGMLNQQLGVQQADLDFRKQMYEDEKAFSDPLRNQLREQALAEGPLDYAPMRDQLSEQYGLAERNLETRMAQRGLTGSNLDAGATRGLLLRQAGDLSRAYQSGLINKRGLALSLLNHDNRMPAAGLVGQGNQNLAATYGQFGAMYGQGAQAGYGAASNALMNGLYLWQLNNRNRSSNGGDGGAPYLPPASSFQMPPDPSTNWKPMEPPSDWGSYIPPEL